MEAQLSSSRSFSIIPLVGSIFVFPHLDEPRLVERARREVLAALRSGVFAGTGLDANQPLKPRASIPADSWPSFDVHFEASEISTGRAVFRDVPITVVETRGKRPAPVRFSEDAARKWFQ